VIKLNKDSYNVAVVGATGAVGQEMLKILEERGFPIDELTLLASDYILDCIHHI